MNFPFLPSYYFAHFQTSIRDLHNSEIPILLLRSCSTSSEIQTNGRRKKVTKNFFPSFSFRSWIYLVARIFRSQAIEFRRSTCKEYEHTNSRDIRERDSKFEKWRIRERERERGGERRCISKVGATRQRSGCINTRRSNQLASRRACSRNKHLKVIPDDLKQRLRPRVRQPRDDDERIIAESIRSSQPLLLSRGVLLLTSPPPPSPPPLFTTSEGNDCKHAGAT